MPEGGILAFDAMKCKAQGGLEFLIISGVVLFFFTVFFVAIRSNIEEKNDEKENLVIKNLALSIQDEIKLAKEATDGYIREFNVPETILGRQYEAILTDNHLYIKTNKNAISLQVENLTGEIQKGNNIIKKQNGRVTINL